MKSSLSPTRACAAFAVLSVALAAASQATAATTLVKFGFDAAGGGNNINEATGWDGTGAAAGGSIDSNVILTSGLKVAGAYTAGNGTDAFHVDNWHSTDLANQVSAGNNVSFTIAPQAGFAFNLGDGTSVFSTRLHDHAQSGDPWQNFDRVSLYIAGNYIGDQTFVHGPGNTDAAVQTLTWNIGLMPALTNLLGPTDFAIYFWDSTAVGATPGLYEPGVGDNAHGPNWSLADSAYIQLDGIIGAPVPEPSRMMLAAFGLVLGVVRRRRR